MSLLYHFFLDFVTHVHKLFDFSQMRRFIILSYQKKKKEKRFMMLCFGFQISVHYASPMHNKITLHQQLIRVFSLFLLLFLGSIVFFGIIYESHCTI